MKGLAGRLSGAALAAAMAAIGHRLWRPFERALAAPDLAQAGLLGDILAANAATAFGRRHGFDRLDDYAAYRSAVPVANYEDLRPYIDAQIETGAPGLTVAPPVFYARTSGTTGAAKLVPVTARGMRRHRDVQRLFAYALHGRTDAFGGRVLAFAGAAVEGRTPRGTPIGSASGAIYAQMPAPVRHRYVVPAEVFTIADYDLRDYVIALLALAAADVSALAAANPSTLVRLQRVIAANWDRLLDDLRGGHTAAAERLDPGQRRALARRLAADPHRARSLRRRVGPRGPDGFGDIWPGLASVVTWTGGSCGYALEALHAHLPENTRVIDAGYHASECRGTVNIDPAANTCVPLVTTTFFEFVEREARERDGGPFLTLGEIEEGRDYYVFVTTLDGLYRYDMNDIVRVTGRFAATPTLAFVQKGRGITSITGEKLSETQALSAVRRAAARQGLRAPFFLLLADEAGAVYRLFAETGCAQAAARLAAEVEGALVRANIEYAAKRASGRLRPVSGVALRPGAGEAYRRHRLAQGQRDAQFKIEHLQCRRQVDFDLDAHAVGA